MAKTSYYLEREINCINKINGILEELPYFVADFLVGVEQRTTPLTRLNYAYDLRIFFDFLSKKVFRKDGRKKYSHYHAVRQRRDL